MAAPGRDATPDSPAFSHSCHAVGAGSRSWSQTHPLYCGPGTGPADQCPRRDEEAGGPQLDRKQPHGMTGLLPGPLAPGMQSVELIKGRWETAQG